MRTYWRPILKTPEAIEAFRVARRNYIMAEDNTQKRRTHHLKCWPQYFQAVKIGAKTFEVRKNDRDYQVDDEIHLREWSQDKQEYTGDDLWFVVSYVLKHCAFVQEGYAVLGLSTTSVPPKLKAGNWASANNAAYIIAESK